MINGIFFWSASKTDVRTYGNIQKIATKQGDDYIIGCLLDYVYFKSYHKMISIDLSKQQVLDVISKPIQEMNFTENLDRPGNRKMFFTIWELRETILYFSQGTVSVVNSFFFNVILR